MSQNQRIKEAVKELLSSDKKKTTLFIENENVRAVSLPKFWYNTVVFTLQQKLVPCHFKNWLLRTTGMNVGHDVCIPHDISFDARFPQLITIRDGALVGGGSTLRGYRIEKNAKGCKLTIGKVEIKERAMSGGMCTLFPGAVIGKNCILGMNSATFDAEMGEGQLWEGTPAKMTHQFSAEEIEKYFKPATKDPAEQKKYYAEFRQKVDAFFADPTQTYLKIYYNGNRLGAGNDWFRARNIIRLFFNGGVVEFTRLLPSCWLKTALLRMIGTRIGKNCTIDKGVVIDHIFPETITLEDNVVLEHDVYLDGHEYTITQTVFGRTVVKSGARIGAGTLVRIGTTIGENSIIEPKSLAHRVIPDNEVWGGIPAKFVRKIDKK